MGSPIYLDKENFQVYKAPLSYQNMREIADNDRAIIKHMTIPLMGFWPYRSDADTIGVTGGSAVINGIPRYIATALTHAYTPPTDGFWLDIWLGADGAGPSPTMVSVSSGAATPGGSANPYTNGLCIGSIKFINSTQDIVMWNSFRGDYVCGWYHWVGNDSTTMTQTITYGVTFQQAPIPIAHCAGKRTTYANSIDALNASWGGTYQSVESKTSTTTNFNMKTYNSTSFSSSHYFGFTWWATGPYLTMG